MAVSHCARSSRFTAVPRYATISVCVQQQGDSSRHQCLSSGRRLSSGEALSSSQSVCRLNAVMYSSHPCMNGVCPPARSVRQTLSTYATNFPPDKLITCCVGGRTVHTSACSLWPKDRPHITSQRGKLVSLKDAKQYVASLSAVQRSTLEQALQETRPTTDESKDTAEGHSAGTRPSTNQLKLLCYQSALPFIGFGFLDNVIMITVGEYIDWTLGLTLGISTMAAAGLGNMISDLAGLGLADQVEAFCLRLGIPNPNLSSDQLKHRSSRWTILLGRCIGIVIGCTVGMAPLLWIGKPHKVLEDCTHDHKDK